MSDRKTYMREYQRQRRARLKAGKTSTSANKRTSQHTPNVSHDPQLSIDLDMLPSWVVYVAIGVTLLTLLAIPAYISTRTQNEQP
jgi:hypothetical protein